MANVFATYSVGNSLVTYLRNAYPAALKVPFPMDFRVISAGEIAEAAEPKNTLTLFLFRITQNEFLRTRRRPNDASDASSPLSIDLHFLMTVWADVAPAEHTVMSWAMRELQMHPVLDSSSLSAEAAWEPSDMVQIIPAEITSEEMMRIWDLLLPKYRLSTSYIARAVRIDVDPASDARPVVASRITAGQLVTP